MCLCPQSAKVGSDSELLRTIRNKQRRGRAVACCRRWITTNQRLQIIIFLYYIVGANCVRPFLICYELAGDRRSPLRGSSNSKTYTTVGTTLAVVYECDYTSNFLRTGLAPVRKPHFSLPCVKGGAEQT